ncbi:hypothetical protein CRENBAI_018068 [Crenichthys baileyi]|uniref:Uncharacterized protein n=1 Tax=Crenichthys baileyi TaxID=28760 RepID=A0AAV9RQW8_9TELE
MQNLATRTALLTTFTSSQRVPAAPNSFRSIQTAEVPSIHQSCITVIIDLHPELQASILFILLLRSATSRQAASVIGSAPCRHGAADVRVQRRTTREQHASSVAQRSLGSPPLLLPYRHRLMCSELQCTPYRSYMYTSHHPLLNTTQRTYCSLGTKFL